MDGLPLGWLAVERYDRGWFGSSASAEPALQPAPGSRRHPVPAAGLARIRLPLLRSPNGR